MCTISPFTITILYLCTSHHLKKCRPALASRQLLGVGGGFSIASPDLNPEKNPAKAWSIIIACLCVEEEVTTGSCVYEEGAAGYIHVWQCARILQQPHKTKVSTKTWSQVIFESISPSSSLNEILLLRHLWYWIDAESSSIWQDIIS